jgi:hypothetical protein
MSALGRRRSSVAGKESVNRCSAFVLESCSPILWVFKVVHLHECRHEHVEDRHDKIRRNIWFGMDTGSESLGLHPDAQHRQRVTERDITYTDDPSVAVPAYVLLQGRHAEDG